MNADLLPSERHRCFLNFVLFGLSKISHGQDLTLKEPGGRNTPPPDIFCYISAGCYFFALKLHDFFSPSLALDLRPFFKKKSDLGL